VDEETNKTTMEAAKAPIDGERAMMINRVRANTDVKRERRGETRRPRRRRRRH